MTRRARWTWWLLLALALALPLRGWAALVPGSCHELPATAAMDHAAHAGHGEHGADAPDAGQLPGQLVHHLSPCCLALAPPLASLPAALAVPTDRLPPAAAPPVSPALWPVDERPPTR